MTALQGEKTTFRGWGKFTEISGELCSAADGREDLLIFELCLDFHHMDSETMHNRSKFAPITSCLRYTWCFNQSKNRHLWKVKMDGTEGWSWILYRKRVKVRLEISRINVSLSKHKRRWSERFEQNEVKEMKRFPDTEMVTIPGYSLKGLRRKKKTLMFVVPVHKPFTSGETLWIQCQTNFVRITLQSPGHKQQNIFTWLAGFMSGNKTFRVYYRNSGSGNMGECIFKQKWWSLI